MAWTKVLNTALNFSVMTNKLPTKGNLVYEYNPLRNYRLSENKYFYNGQYYSREDLELQFDIITENEQTWKYKDGTPLTGDVPELYEKGQLIDFVTDELKFSLEHPVNIVPQYSYDGSVNLIINDGINVPRLINSRFSATGKNTYEIVDRKGNNDTNIYDQGDQFDIDTSLYKRVVKIPKIIFAKIDSGGNLKVGNYHFYFKLADADGNETDFVGESGLVSIFVGFDNPKSAHTGNKNENSYKSVSFLMTDIDSSYDYVTVYYSRNTAENNDNSVTEYVKISKKFIVNKASEAQIVITGFEESEVITASDINLSYNIVDAAHTSAVCQNMLFLGNVHKPDIQYQELSDLALRFLPYVKEETYMLDIDHNYNISSTDRGYYDPQFIYHNTGYWNKEFYRFGIVFIMPNNELTPVFNIRGRHKVKPFKVANQGTFKDCLYNDGQYCHYYLTNKQKERTTIQTQEANNYIIPPDEKEGIIANNNKSYYENSKGVVTFDSQKDNNTIYSLDIRVDDETLQELKKYVKGYFFVRQTRIPTILAQGITIGLDKESRTPTLPTARGILEDLSDSLQSTYVETKDINDVNYISEGFLSRYSFSLKMKSSALWKKIGTSILKVAAITVVAVGASVLIPGGAALLGTVMGKVGLDIGFYAAIAIASGVSGVAAGAATGLGMTAAATVQEIVNVVKRTKATIKLEGRNTKIPGGYYRSENSSSRTLSTDFYDRIIIKDDSKNEVAAILCPDYSVNQPYYNQIFTGNNHILRSTIAQNINELAGYSSSFFENEENHFYVPSYYDNKNIQQYNCKIIGIPDNVKVLGLENSKFRSRAGEAEEAFRYEQIGEKQSESSDIKINSDIIRGSFGPYLGVLNFPKLPCTTVDIMIPGYSESNIEEYIDLRMNDNSVFHTISDRYDIANTDEHLIKKMSNIVSNVDRSCGYSWNLHRGDCYICQFTHRLNRNFNDPSAPYNDEIVDGDTWRDNYDPDNTEKYEQINLGDVNAVQLGMWVTFKIRSSYNLNIRTLDSSNVDEEAMTGHPRAYFPYQPMSTEGTYKIPESGFYNKGFAKSVSDRWHFELPDVPHIKNWFGTRIMYSDSHINDAYKNGFRVFQGTHYRDYTREYGEIVKLVPFESSLLCVFEHGVALIPVNERAIAGQGAGGNVYINTSNVLPENPKVISDMFGSQWPESVLKVPGRTGDSPQYVYGVDTIAKKIWRTDGNTLECISDFKVQEFLNNNITLGERELTPKIGIRNVKTHYNAFKRDVMFTFYDNTYGCEEKVWNLCWNELLQKFITFYSWVPSYMENINNIPFSFDRNTSKWIAKLGVSHSENSFADGITLTNVVIEDSFRNNGQAVNNTLIPISYITKQGITKTVYADVSKSISYFDGQSWKYNANGLPKFIAGLQLSNRIMPDKQVHYRVDYELLHDSWKNYELFRIVPIKDYTCIREDGSTYQNHGEFKLPDDAMFPGAIVPVYALCFNDGDDEWQEVYYKDGDNYALVDNGVGGRIYTYKPLYKPEALYSELYYRNSAGNAYADYDVHKLGTTTITQSNVPQYQIVDEETLAWLEEQYPPETVIGNTSTKYNQNNPPEYVTPCTTLGQIRSIMTYDNKGVPRVHNILLSQHWTVASTATNTDRKVWYDLPIFKDITGKRPMLPKNEQVNPDKLVTLLNIKATISISDSDNANKTLDDAYYNNKAKYAEGSTLVNQGYYESTVAIAPRWNLQFLSTDFWKHGQAGIIDIADDIFPTYWYGKQHPFEFEVVVVNDPSVHKIFSNLELVANKAKPESFHYEIIGECYDFAKDKPNMYFRQEALKALWQYNGADITYNRDFLKVQPKQQPKSADLPHRYYTRQDTINDIEDYYISVTYPKGYDYRHLSGAEIVRYPNRQEYRIWNHAKAVCLDDLSQDDARSIIAANCQYLEDRWKVTINPILVCYRNEYARKFQGSLIQPQNSLWVKSVGGESLPRLPIYNSPIPDKILQQGEIKFPDTSTGEGKDNALYGLYQDLYNAIDTTNWLNAPDTYGYVYNRKHYSEQGMLTHVDYYDANGAIVKRDYYDNQGKIINTEYARSYGANNRKELDLKDKFMKVRIRYSGEELAVIDFLNTVYRISYA